MTKPGHRFTPAEDEQIIDMRAQGMSVSDIAYTLRVDPRALRNRISRLNLPNLRPEQRRHRHIDQRTLDERDARAAAYERRDITATRMGDPPVGYSALDRRGQT